MPAAEIQSSSGTGAPVAPPTVDADIAAFLSDTPGARGGETIESLEETAEDVSDAPALAQVPDDEDEEAEDSDEETDTKPKEKKSKDGVDMAKVQKALEKKDLQGLIDAMGPIADEMLTSKAHKTLRVQAKELRDSQLKAEAASKKAEELTDRLKAKYSDPIEVRKAFDSTDPNSVDKFIDHCEKISGVDWNKLMQWVGKGITGRAERLQSKTRETETQASTKKADQERALQVTKDWVTDGIKKAGKPAEPELVDAIIVELKNGLTLGVDSPAKALPLALAKLKDTHERLSKIFDKAPATKTKAKSPSSKRDEPREGQRTRPRTLEEDIADIKRELGGR